MQLFEYIDVRNQPYDIFYTDSVNSPLHWHYYSELIYMSEGIVTITCNERETVLKKGDLCYFYPLQLHAVSKAIREKEHICSQTDGSQSHGDQDLYAMQSVKYAVLKFDLHTIHLPEAYLSTFYDIFLRRSRKEDFCIILKADKIDQEWMGNLISQMINEYQKKDTFYSLQIQADLYSLLIDIARKQKTKQHFVRKKRQDLEFSFYHILEYIDSHSGEHLEIQDLARRCHMSYSYFAKLFRENYGRSCKEYITYIRLNKAQELLIHTNYDMDYIALETGFCDCSHFIRTYKKWRGITPKQERLLITANTL